MSARIFLEGGGNSKELNIRCREGFRKLFAKCGFEGRMPTLIPGGGRNDVLADFARALRSHGERDFVALLIDSETPPRDIEATWQHLQGQRLTKPTDATDEQLLFMTTCMETWIVADRSAFSAHFGNASRDSVLPSLHDLESRLPVELFGALRKATSGCRQPYAKGAVSFLLLGKLSPNELERHLPSFRRIVRILQARL